MHLVTRNCNTAFTELVSLFDRCDPAKAKGVYDKDWGQKPVTVVRKPSRNGDVLMIDEPVVITYTHPSEMCLFNAARDVNPTALLYEALWMLAGRNDVAPLTYYTKQFKEYSDDGKTLNGAYGYRWRHAPFDKGKDGKTYYTYEPKEYGTDQLDVIVNHLRADPNSRRAVLTMWNVEDDLLKIGLKTTTPLKDENNPGYRGTMETVAGASRDVCCNLNVMFAVRDNPICEPDGACRRGDNCWTHSVWEDGSLTPRRKLLDITVTNRSNDLVWGLLGANYVTFSVLQSYMAARLGVGVGRYHHMTNNLHCYGWNWKPNEWLADITAGYDSIDVASRIHGDGGIKTVPLVRDPEAFEREIKDFVECNHGAIVSDQVWAEPFLQDVARPMCRAYFEHKSGNTTAASEWATRIKADDWRLAATAWLKRRQERAKA